MKCETFQTEFLGLLDPQQLSAELHRHAEQCPSCRTLATFTQQIESSLPKLPVPAPSPDVQAAFLNQLMVEPVVSSRQNKPSQKDSGSFFQQAFQDLPTWKVLSGLAASLFVASGVWWAFREPSPNTRPAVAYHRHQLLAKQVQHTVALAQTTTAEKRLVVWSELAGDLREEAQRLYRIAQADEMNSLSGMFETAVQQGVIGQAEALPPTVAVVERNQLLNDALTKLQKLEAETDQLSSGAPPQSQPALKRIAQSAKKGQERLQTLLQQGGA